MTITLMVSTPEGTIAASDLLISRKTKDQTFFPATFQAGFEYSESNLYRPTRIEQKLTRLADNVLLCWAGSPIQARAMARHLRDGINSSWWSREAVKERIEQFPRGDDNELIGFVLITHANKVSSMSINCWPYPLAEIDEAYCLGSGAPAFHQWAEAQLATGNATSLGSLGTALMFLGPSLIFQAETGFGLDDGWGGGFQAAYRTEEGWKFVDRILIRLWEGVYDNGEVSAGITRLIYQFYENDDLFVFSDGMDGLPGSWAVARTIHAPFVHVLPSEQSHTPEWVIDLISHQGKVLRSAVSNQVDEETQIKVSSERFAFFIPRKTYDGVFLQFREAIGKPLRGDRAAE